jgi:hypothetical protein
MPTLTTEAPYNIQGKYVFYGEEFLIEEEEGHIILHHPLWSLAGSGKSLGEAEHDLLGRAEILFEVYSKIPASELSVEALTMLAFLHKIV